MGIIEPIAIVSAIPSTLPLLVVTDGVWMPVAAVLSGLAVTCAVAILRNRPARTLRLVRSAVAS